MRTGRPKLPICCKDCGDTDPEHFYPREPSRCKKCRAKRQQPADAKGRNQYLTRLRKYRRRQHRALITRKVMAYVEMRIRWGFEAPSQEEIAQAVKVSIPTARKYLQVLEQDGKIVREEKRHRRLQLAG